MPVRRIEVRDEAVADRWKGTDYIVGGFALFMPLLAICLIVLTR